MKILIVEDQKDKSDDITKFFETFFRVELEIHVKQSLRSGLKELLTINDFNLIVLDMSMPNFDPGPEDPIGGTPESFAGKEFLAQMDLREISTPVVVVTQYATFAKGQIELEELDFLFRHEYQNFYHGSVYYSSADKEWQKELERILMEIFK
jgi:CheY-like chemotaxis protein